MQSSDAFPVEVYWFWQALVGRLGQAPLDGFLQGGSAQQGISLFRRVTHALYKDNALAGGWAIA